MLNDKIKMSQEGYDKLQEEYQELITTGRKEIADMLKEAVSFGDLSENAEYEVARKLQVELENKILQIQDKITRADIVDEAVGNDKVAIGVSVKVLDELKEEVIYKIVGDTEGDIIQYKLSVVSPVGKALLGHKVGDKVKMEVPNGKIEYKILDIFTK